MSSHDVTDEDWLRFFEVNVLSGGRLSRFYLPQMLKKNWGNGFGSKISRLFTRISMSGTSRSSYFTPSFVPRSAAMPVARKAIPPSNPTVSNHG
jgi:NAD(P)-dependent dehydrogenase (short-subunit alcohol dehydrogenase family)